MYKSDFKLDLNGIQLFETMRETMLLGTESDTGTEELLVTFAV